MNEKFSFFILSEQRKEKKNLFCAIISLWIMRHHSNCESMCWIFIFIVRLSIIIILILIVYRIADYYYDMNYILHSNRNVVVVVLSSILSFFHFFVFASSGVGFIFPIRIKNNSMECQDESKPTGIEFKFAVILFSIQTFAYCNWYK